jgi:hypothetical protein
MERCGAFNSWRISPPGISFEVGAHCSMGLSCADVPIDLHKS